MSKKWMIIVVVFYFVLFSIVAVYANYTNETSEKISSEKTIDVEKKKKNESEEVICGEGYCCPCDFGNDEP